MQPSQPDEGEPAGRSVAISRDEILAQQGLVAQVARQTSRFLPRWLPLDDLIGAGQLGLIRAARRYDPSYGIPFDIWARYEIRHAIVSANRRRNYDWELHEQLPSEIESPPPQVDREILGTQNSMLIEEGLMQLPERERVALQTYLTGETLVRLGKRLGVSESSACQIRREARKNMRAILEDMGVRPSDLFFD